MDPGHSAALQMDYGEGREMSQSVRTPIFKPAGVQADNRNLWQGSSGWRVCVRVGAFIKSWGADRKTEKLSIKMNSPGGGGGGDKKTKLEALIWSQVADNSGLKGYLCECACFQ